MKATSAGECGGRVARVEDGNVLLGAPGAPGCTTTGLAGSFCCPRAAGKKGGQRLAASIAPIRIHRAERGFELRSEQKLTCLQLGVRGKIFIGTKKQSFHEIGNFHRGRELKLSFILS